VIFEIVSDNTNKFRANEAHSSFDTTDNSIFPVVGCGKLRVSDCISQVLGINRENPGWEYSVNPAVESSPTSHQKHPDSSKADNREMIIFLCIYL
jgi:hypothetical protein